ncbi:HAMP domain-containing sensor histidine kinase [Pengzhenrongella frigida]|uniref:histidine kinase n=1 Tax=Pengzhenrongella frigida TaxID=1259133 RepID=A0A4Q5N212_9MICO|nr:HAMP domain-containing sensor histidine kinase [Cellulomonas sp. HLT2-17]RYV52145.1 HAMP domain-containing histidine kinase [Cellulomonas sp. HLT2-17]
MSRRWPGLGGRRDLSTRLLLAIVLVVVVGGVTAWVVVAVVGPAIFRDHMTHLGGATAFATLHAEEAFRTASALSLALALLAALLTSIAVSLFLTGRIARSVAPVTEAAGRVADGDYAARVPAVGMGTEFDDLAEAFNTMAGDLGRIEVSRSQMLGDLAHEMRTPVATLGAYLEAIAEGFEQADAPTLAMLRDQVARLSRLSEDIALVTTAEEGRLTMRRTTVAVAQMVADAAAQATGRYETGGVNLGVRVAPTAEAALVDADADRIAQVLTNLLDNALRHTPTGGRVDLMVDRAGGAVRIVVADDGEGIPAEHLPHVFDRFYRVDTARDRAHGGSGVGLAIAKVITEAHGGTITAQSEGPGRGAVFTVVLPVARDGAAG